MMECTQTPPIGDIRNLDDYELCRLLQQHDHYDWRECSVERRWERSNGVRRGRWFVYHQAKAIQCWYKPDAEAQCYGSLVEALEAAEKFSDDVIDGRIKTP